MSERKVEVQGKFHDGYVIGPGVLANGKTGSTVIANYLEFALGSQLNPSMVIQIARGDRKEKYDVKFKVESIEKRR